MYISHVFVFICKEICYKKSDHMIIEADESQTLQGLEDRTEVLQQVGHQERDHCRWASGSGARRMKSDSPSCWT